MSFFIASKIHILLARRRSYMMNQVNYEPDFENIKKVLQCQTPDRPTLFEFYLNQDVYECVAGQRPIDPDPVVQLAFLAKAFAACGYDYVNTYACEFVFPTKENEEGIPGQLNGLRALNERQGNSEKKRTISLNANEMIESWEEFENYNWPDAKIMDYSLLKKIEPFLPGKMKLMATSPAGGLLEAVISIVGYENLCFMIYDEPELVQAIFDRVGQILLDYYTECVKYDTVGMIMVNDDWGFNTQTMLSVADLRKYVFPWQKKIVEVAHQNGKFAVLHSCGYMVDIMEDIITDMKFDGRHSYEDNIIPVEEAYERWGGRIAILGGIDVDFLSRHSEAEIQERAKRMLLRTVEKGGYALGSGNSIPEYIPKEHYFAMTSAVTKI